MPVKLWRDNYRVWVIALLLGLLIGANSLIKILRDSIFLGHHSVSELPYLYILVAIIAGLVIATYSRYTAHISILRLILATHATILAAIVFFWVVLSYFDPAWSHYAFYIWSAMARAIIKKSGNRKKVAYPFVDFKTRGCLLEQAEKGYADGRKT